jgi:invasion protein IalB
MFMKPAHALLAALALSTAPAALAQETAPAEGTAAGTEAAPAVQSPIPAAPATDAAAPEADAPAAEAPAAEPDAQADANAADAAPAADAPATEDGAAPADPAAEEGEPRVGSYYLMEEHGDWMIRCIRAGQGKDPCEMYKLLSDEDDNAVAEFTLIPLTNGQVAAGATLIAPLETDLIEGLGLQVDNGEMRGYPFSVCTPVGCVSRLGFTDAELAAMKRGNRATVQLVPFGGDAEQPVRLPFSLTGFTAAFDSLTAYAAAPAPEPQDDAADAEDADAEAAPAEDAPAQ